VAIYNKLSVQIALGTCFYYMKKGYHIYKSAAITVCYCTIYKWQNAQEPAENNFVSMDCIEALAYPWKFVLTYLLSNTLRADVYKEFCNKYGTRTL
jgi:hypothetical protein